MEQPQTTPTDASWGEAAGESDREASRRPESEGEASRRAEREGEASRRPEPEAWSAGYGAPRPPPRAGLDFSALFALLDALRRAAPVEVQERLTAFIREALLTLRSLIDWYLDRLEARPREPRVEDIPID